MERRVAATWAADEAQVDIDMWLVDAWSIQDQAFRVLGKQINMRGKENVVASVRSEHGIVQLQVVLPLLAGTGGSAGRRIVRGDIWLRC
jgi:hypothetical protein